MRWGSPALRAGTGAPASPTRRRWQVRRRARLPPACSRTTQRPPSSSHSTISPRLPLRWPGLPAPRPPAAAPPTRSERRRDGPATTKSREQTRGAGPNPHKDPHDEVAQAVGKPKQGRRSPTLVGSTEPDSPVPSKSAERPRPSAPETGIAWSLTSHSANGTDSRPLPSSARTDSDQSSGPFRTSGPSWRRPLFDSCQTSPGAGPAHES